MRWPTNFLCGFAFVITDTGVFVTIIDFFFNLKVVIKDEVTRGWIDS